MIPNGSRRLPPPDSAVGAIFLLGATCAGGRAMGRLRPQPGRSFPPTATRELAKRGAGERSVVPLAEERP
jgi:hypothetical protein